jgi:hypothetical protein
MNPIRRELLNGIFVLVLSTLLSAGFAAFQVEFDAQLLVWIVIGVCIGLGFYIVFELTLRFIAASGAREEASEVSTRRREEEWLMRVGTPARLVLNREGEPAAMNAVREAVTAITPSSDYTVMYYFDSEGGAGSEFRGSNITRDRLFDTLFEQLLGGVGQLVEKEQASRS